MKKNDVKVSVLIISYKQVKYIKQAIDSVLMQKVDYDYEILLADDCSKDGTLEIMKEYKKKYPNMIKILERKKNLGAAQNSLDARLKAKGEYVVYLEGDDYWCDENKLKTQSDFLDEHPDFSAIAHIQEGRNLDNEIVGYFPKSVKKDTVIYGVEDFIKNAKNFSASSVMYRNFNKDVKRVEEYKYFRSIDPLIGDAQLSVFLCTLGKIFILYKPMMVYRIRNNDGNSNFNSSHSISEIKYRYMNIYIKLEEHYKNKYSFFRNINRSYTLGVAYSIAKRNFKDIKKFNDLCPKKYKFKIYFLFPFTCISILYDRFIKK